MTSLYQVPYQPSTGPYQEKNGRHFLPHWYKLLPDWLEYSPTKHCAFCLPCYLSAKTTKRASSSAFTSEGFSSWKNIISGKDRDFLSHVGEGPNSLHRNAVQSFLDLSNQVTH